MKIGDFVMINENQKEVGGMVGQIIEESVDEEMFYVMVAGRSYSVKRINAKKFVPSSWLVDAMTKHNHIL